MKNLKTICYRSFKIEQQKASDGKLRALPPPRNSRLKVRIEVRFFWHTLTIRHSSENLALHHRIHESSLHGNAPLQHQLAVSRVNIPPSKNSWSQRHQLQVRLPARNDRDQLGTREYIRSFFELFLNDLHCCGRATARSITFLVNKIVAVPPPPHPSSSLAG